MHLLQVIWQSALLPLALWGLLNLCCQLALLSFFLLHYRMVSEREKRQCAL